MADLFDLKVGGLGFHMTAHLLAIIALFVACFAITGYISFRDDSIDRDALKDGEGARLYDAIVDLEGVTVVNGTDAVVLKQIATIPSDTFITSVRMECVELATAAELQLGLAVSATAGTVSGTAVVTPTDLIADSGNFMDSGSTVGDLSTAGQFADSVNVGTKTALYVINADNANTGGALTSGKFRVYIEYYSSSVITSL